MTRLCLLPLGLSILMISVPPSGATDTAICDRADVAIFHVAARDAIAIRVRRLGRRQAAEFEGPGFHRVLHANRRGRAVLHVRPRRAGRAGVTVQCNDRFSVRVTEDDE